MATAQETVRDLLALADVKIGGKRPFDVQVHDERFYKTILARGAMGLGESYMEGWWSTPRLDELICRVQSANLQSKVRLSPSMLRVVTKAKLTNQQTLKRASKNAAHHYNIGNDLYERNAW